MDFEKGMEFIREADESTSGTASFVTQDPDGNPILVVQRVQLASSCPASFKTSWAALRRWAVALGCGASILQGDSPSQQTQFGAWSRPRPEQVAARLAEGLSTRSVSR